MPKPPSERRDWAGSWFALLEERGEDTRIRFGVRRSGEAGEPEWHLLPHARFDGVGGLAYLLEQRGRRPAALPRLKERQPPSLRRRLRALQEHLFTPPARPRRWKGSEAAVGRIPGNLELRPVHHCLSVEATRALLERARSQNVTLNTLLLWALGRAAAPHLESEGEPLWMIPVNMRGPVELPEYSNHASYLQLRVEDGASPARVQQGRDEALAAVRHWGVWQAINLGRWVGLGGMRKLLQAEERKSRAWVGSFSNLGDWRSPEGAGANGDEWFFCPPVTQRIPVSAGAVTWDGKLSLSLQAHPSVTRDKGRMSGWLEAWLRELEIEVTS